MKQGEDRYYRLADEILNTLSNTKHGYTEVNLQNGLRKLEGYLEHDYKNALNTAKEHGLIVLDDGILRITNNGRKALEQKGILMYLKNKEKEEKEREEREAKSAEESMKLAKSANKIANTHTWIYAILTILTMAVAIYLAVKC